MPLKIPGVCVVTGHRPEIEKERNPKPKDLVPPDPLPSFRPRQQSKPLIQVRAPSPYNKYPSASKVTQAIQSLHTTRSHDEVQAQVRDLLNKALPATLTQPAVIFIGERHGEPLDLSLALSALGHVRGHASKQLLFEKPPTYVKDNLIPIWMGNHEGEFADAMRTGASFNPGRREAVNNWIAVGLYSKAAGFDLGGFDAEHETASDAEARERAMLGSISSQIANKQVTVVLAGFYHLPYFHEKLSAMSNITTVSMMDCGGFDNNNPIRGEQVERLSYALSTSTILKIKPDLQAMGGRLDPVQFIKAHGLDAGLPHPA